MSNRKQGNKKNRNNRKGNGKQYYKAPVREAEPDVKEPTIETNLTDNEEIGNNMVENFWIRKVLPHRVKSLPYDKLSQAEQVIIDKINNDEEISDSELTIIKKTTAEYGIALEKYDAEKIIKSHEDFEQIVIDETELLSLVEDCGKEQELIMNVPFKTGIKTIKWIIKPLDDSRAVKLTEQHMDIYKDLTDEEMKVQQKGLRGEKLSKAEQDVIEHINQKLMEVQLDERINDINEFLAWQIEPPTFDDMDRKIEFWENFPFNSKMSLFLKVRDLLGLSEEFNDKLFPSE